MINLVFFLEEPSAQALLEGLLPRFLPMDRVMLRFVVFEGKQDLEKQLVRRMRHWRAPNSHFIVLRDQDSADCKDVKQRLTELCREARRPEALVRVACREIESWYLGDLAAVERGLQLNGVARRQAGRKFRRPDRLGSPSRELACLTKGLYQKVGGSRAIAPHLSLDGTNRSHSFAVFVSGVRRLVEQALEGT
jgi:hypothetical protein